jgi:hypothetical protein
MDAIDKNQVFEELTSSNAAVSTSLPDLSEQQSWIKELAEKYSKQAYEYIKSLFPDSSPFLWSHSFETLAIFIELFLYLALVVFVVFVLIQIYSKMRLYSFIQPKVELVKKMTTRKDENLHELLNKHLANGLFGQAMRIRWKIFLSNLGIMPSVTPLELSINQENLEQEINLKRVGISELYRYMFGPIKPTQSEYQEYSDMILSIERSAGVYEH